MSNITTTNWLDSVKFDEQGLIPAIAQDNQTGRILMMAWMNRESLLLTAQQQRGVYYSRSRQKLWFKGESSGHIQQVSEIRLDCDGDVIVLMVHQVGDIACHTGRTSCFYQVLRPEGWVTVDPVLKDPAMIYGNEHTSQGVQSNAMEEHAVLAAICRTINNRKQQTPDSSYVASLFHKGLNKILEKVGEESIETILAAKDANANHVSDLVYETADLWFHSLVMLSYFDVDASAVLNELARRMGISGHVEKASRHQPK